MSDPSTFGATPERLRRLLLVGSDEQQEPNPLTTSWDLLGEKPGSQVGRYKLLSVLGEGGMGVVYLAEQKEPISRRVALKVIKPGMDSKQVIARFEAERQALALLDHPNIARIHDAGTTETGRPYFVMEYIKGLPITEYCDQKQLSIEARLRLFQQVCAAVQYAHQKGIIHRDIKPSNILVCDEDDHGVPKIIDFGVAKALAASLTGQSLTIERGQLLGTPDYMSPEQVEFGSQAMDVRTDVYSLGVVLYVLLAGNHPLDATMFAEGGISILRKLICEDDPKTPSTQLSVLGGSAAKIASNRSADVKTLAKRLKQELEWIPLKAMSKEPARRYQSAADLVDDIENYLTGAPLSAGPPSTIYRIKKLVRRNRTLVASLLIVFVVLIAGVIVSTLFAVGESHARKDAERQVKISNEVTRFFNQDVLLAASPYRMGGHETTVKEALESASLKIPGKFPDDPLVEASIRYTLGQTYLYLGYLSMAEPHLQAVLRIYREQFGEEDLKTLWVGRYLGLLYQRQGRYVEAEHLFRKAFTCYQKVRGRRHASTLQLMFDVARVCMSQGRYDDGEPLCAEVLEGRRIVLGKDHPYTLNTEVSLATFWHFQGRSEQAENLLIKALKRQTIRYGEEHPYTTVSMGWLGYMYRDLGRYAEAERWLKKALAIDRQVLGDRHSDTLCCMNALATVYTSQKRYDEARVLFVEVLRTRHSIFGTNHPHTLESMNDFGVYYLQRCQFENAEEFLIRAAGGRIQMLGPEHPDTVATLTNLARLHERSMPAATLIGESRLSNPFFVPIYVNVPLLGPVEAWVSEDLLEGEAATEPRDGDSVRLVDDAGRADDLETLVTQQGGVCVDIGRIEYDKELNAYTVVGAGRDIWGTHDQFHFAHKQLTGDGMITVRLESIERVRPWTKAGIMVRETLDPNSPYAAVVVTPEHRICLQYRMRAGLESRTIQSKSDFVTLPHWIGLVREGDTFTARHSKDGSNWENLKGNDYIGRTYEQKQIPAVAMIQMTETANIGLAVTSNAGLSITATARMSGLTTTGDIYPKGEFILSDDIGFQMIALPKGMTKVYTSVAE